MKKKLFLLQDWLLRQSGKFLMLTSVLGLIIDARYDIWVGRIKEAQVWGFWQWAYAGYCCITIYIGYLFDDFMRDIK